MMMTADIVAGANGESLIKRSLPMPDVAYVHAHNAKPGCASSRIDRA
jgi:hypothetical protein